MSCPAGNPLVVMAASASIEIYHLLSKEDALVGGSPSECDAMRAFAPSRCSLHDLGLSAPECISHIQSVRMVARTALLMRLLGRERSERSFIILDVLWVIISFGSSGGWYNDVMWMEESANMADKSAGYSNAIGIRS